MQVLLLSDLHSEHYPNPETLQAMLDSVTIPADVVVLAGDILNLSDGWSAKQTLNHFSTKYQHVIEVLGNHEYWGMHPAYVHSHTRALVAQYPNVHLLDNSAVTIEGQRFLGGTMWFPSDPLIFRAKTNDWRMIPGFDAWFGRENEKFKYFIQSEVEVTPDDLVVTHYLPSYSCVAAPFKGAPTNLSFVCEMGNFIAATQPRKWLFGHTHFPVSETIGTTQLLCNPRGYPNQNPDYDPMRGFFTV